ncbi:MAG: hypothetical protein H8E14_15370 [Candidatus Marinimicrobia bacterium]|nr:hypothetical protein [Candidatus Neomarinimicrobiota bacterium]
MEGSGYWVILILLYLLSMWAKKRKQAQQRERLNLEEDGTIEPATRPPAPQSEFLSKMLREAGFDFGEEETVAEDIAVATAVEVQVPERESVSIRERRAEFDQELGERKAPEELYSPVLKKSYRRQESAYAIPVQNRSKLIPDLDDLDDLREAIILKEILDKPRALRRRIR